MVAMLLAVAVSTAAAGETVRVGHPAVVCHGDAPAYDWPGGNQTTVLPEGTRVYVVDERDGWSAVTAPDSRYLWVRSFHLCPAPGS